MSESLLHLEKLTKAFDGTPVLRGISLSVARGEFVTLLGPSGCGKTTTLRIIAGLTAPDTGRVLLNGADVTALPPNRRNVNTVFQNYALFPHMNVARNIGYGLRMRGVPRAERARRVQEMLDLVRLEDYGARMPAQLSGGQRQRVAIARAAVLGPDVLLLDEPLGALDLQLRRQMQTELKSLQKRLGIAFVYITHDQEEALNMSDRIAIMNEGRLEQVGTPEDIYERPATRFAAGFIGQGELFEGCIIDVQGDVSHVQTECGEVRARTDPGRRIGDAVCVCVHTERIRYGTQPVDGFELPATVESHRYAGSALQTRLVLHGGRALTTLSAGTLKSLPEPGAQVYIHWDPALCALIGEEARA